jgi:hypothetical protein
MFEVSGTHLTGPVNPLADGADLLDFLCFVRLALARTIASDEEPGRAGAANGFEDAVGRSRSVEGDQKDCGRG